MAAIIAKIRAWYTVGGYYLYWSTTQIADPFSEYPGGYPSALDLTDVVLLDYIY